MSSPRMKLCGLTRKEDFDAAVDLKLDYVGFVFVPSSPRFVSPEQVLSLTGAGEGSGHPHKVGVFADETIEDVRQIYDAAGLDIVQLHGSESSSYCRALGLPFWKVLTSSESIADYAGTCNAPLLLDSRGACGRESSPGNLDLMEAVKAISTGMRIILAGGISISTIGSFLPLKPWGVDFSSSVENSPGLKNHQLLSELVQKIRGN